MLTIRALRNIASAKRHRRLPDSLVEFLEKTFRELHEALEPDVALKCFSLEMHGPIYVLEAGVDTLMSLRKLGLLPDENEMEIFQPEWVEKIDIKDYEGYQLGVMTDNDYLFRVIISVNEFGLDVEQWLEELMRESETYSNQ
jgi:hypothetical protein